MAATTDSPLNFLAGKYACIENRVTEIWFGLGHVAEIFDVGSFLHQILEMFWQNTTLFQLLFLEKK